jgi:hypothetical protein
MKHGSPSTYRHHGCRCDACVEANRQYHRDMRRRRGLKRPASLPDDGIVDWVVVERLLNREAQWDEARPKERRAAAARAFARGQEDAYVFASEYLRLRSEAIKSVRADLAAWLEVAA